jgi:quercetin dioxygenase-like cupin family protein
MNPITFSCEETLPLATEDIARQILDLTKWPDFHGYGPIPGIKAAEFDVQTPGVIGSRIRVTNLDESSHLEEIVEWQPDRIRLEMKEFSPPLARLATGFEETWDFRRIESGTIVSRSFRLHAKSVPARLLLWVISFFLKKAIARHLREMRTLGVVGRFTVIKETNMTRAVIKQRGEGRTMAVVGDVYRFLATGEDTNGKYAMWEAIVPPGGGPPPHVHSREEEGFYILDGEITFTIGDRRIVAKAGLFANMPVGTPHSFKNESGKPAKMLISVAPAGLEKMFFEFGVPLPEGSTAALPPTKEEIERLLAIAPKYGIELKLPKY